MLRHLFLPEICMEENPETMIGFRDQPMQGNIFSFYP